MLPAVHRMRRSTDFRAALRGRRAGTRCLVVGLTTAGAGRPAAPAVAGFAVSRAVGGATTRNLVRRRLRHAMTPHLDRFLPGTRVVVRALPPAAHASYADLDRDLAVALDRVLAGRRPGSADPS